LKLLYRISPFDLTGDCIVPPASDNIHISCVINFFGRLNLLQGILWSLTEQNYPLDQFEVLLVEDCKGTDSGQELALEFSQRLNIRYLPLDSNFGRMGYSRNFGLARSRGKIVLFLDDDTVIQQNNFLELLEEIFTQHLETDAVVPHGQASFSLINGKYNYHDPYFMTSRCTVYRRTVLAKLGGFMNHFVGQEDVEFVVRFLLAGKCARNSPELHYFHPPLLVPNFSKPMAVANSFYNLKRRYPLLIWLLLLLNCSRHAALYLLPSRRCREMGRFGIGFISGLFVSLFKKEGFQYN